MGAKIKYHNVAQIPESKRLPKKHLIIIVSYWQVRTGTHNIITEYEKGLFQEETQPI